MELNEFYLTFSSDSTAGSANQVLTEYDSEKTVTGRCYYKLSHGGENYSLLFSNSIDSTFSDGSVSKANDVGGEWEILSMRAGICRNSVDEPSKWHEATFGGVGNYKVLSPEPFFTDKIPLNAKKDDLFCYEITLRGARYPYHEEAVLPVYIKQPDGSFKPDKRIPLPLMIGSDRKISSRVGFLGDSITQGCGTEVGSYTHWAAKIAEGLDKSISVWNLGIGYARAYDAASNGGWLERAKHCDTVNICFGVNDILRGRTAKQVENDLHTIIVALKAAVCQVILFTVPPFDMTGETGDIWYTVNESIRTHLCSKADAVFDFAAALGASAPNQHIAPYGGHPNAEGCMILACAYLKSDIVRLLSYRKSNNHLLKPFLH
ncbi:MAG: SGNH/GDSL hydrolase family protein [Eubacteriales bacterium]|jgi:lysophospholipase L1-like esterase